MELKTQLIEIVRVFRETFQLNQDDNGLHETLFAEELGEFNDSVMFSDKADALADMVFIASGGIIDGFEMDDKLSKVILWAEFFGIDLMKATKTVFTSNMSKLATLDSINSTRDKYAKLGVEVDFHQVNKFNSKDGFRVICSRTVIGTDGKEYPEGKLLKSTDYKEPDWSYLEGVA